LTTTDYEPLEVRPEPERPKRNGALRVVLVVAVLGAGIALLVTNLSESTTYFKTADEAVAERDELGSRRFRVEGLVTEPVSSTGDAVRFSIMSAGVCVDVKHQGDPPELFKPGIPVVLEGRWQGSVYESDRIMVRHSNEYKEQNPERLQEAAAQQQQYASCAE
jgi:cytochrome c-type biogenesis protein CcmE